MKTAVYSGTRNLYEAMSTAAKSLLFHSSVDKIYFLIEDDEFPEKLPSKIETINVSNQEYFPKNSANFKSPFSYMALLRVCYTKLFPNLDKILQLDVDTVVVDNIDELWGIDLTDKIIDLSVDGPNLHHRIQKSCGTDNLFNSLSGMLFLIIPGRGGNIDHLIQLAVKLRKVQRTVVVGRG